MTNSIDRILATSDGSPESEAVFPAIMPLVRAYGSEVVLLHVFEDPEASHTPPDRVTAACAALRGAGLNATLELRDGEPAEEILRTATMKRADLIALATHGRGGLPRVLIGSVAEEVLRGSTGPVLVTRPGTVVHEFKKIVVALDGSVRSERILEDVERLARKLNASVDLLAVVMPIMTLGVEVSPVVIPAEDPMPYLRGVAARLASHGVEAHPVTAQGAAHDVILRHVTESKASLLCMTTHGRTGLSRLLLGSVAEGVLRKAPCPVLLRRSVEAEGAAPTPEMRTITVY